MKISEISFLILFCFFINTAHSIEKKMNPRQLAKQIAKLKKENQASQVEIEKLENNRIAGGTAQDKAHHSCKTNECDVLAAMCNEANFKPENSCFGVCAVEDDGEGTCVGVYGKPDEGSSCYTQILNLKQRKTVENCWIVRDQKKIAFIQEAMESKVLTIISLENQLERLSQNEVKQENGSQKNAELENYRAIPRQDNSLQIQVR